MGEQTKCPSVGGGDVVRVHHATYSAVEKGEMPLATTRMDLENTLPREVSQTEQGKSPLISFIRGCETENNR